MVIIPIFNVSFHWVAKASIWLSLFLFPPKLVKSFLSPSESHITSVQLAAMPAFQCVESDVTQL